LTAVIATIVVTGSLAFSSTATQADPWRAKPGGGVVTVTPEDDTFVDPAQPDVNLNTDEGPFGALTLNQATLGLVKFTLHQAPSPVRRAKLRLSVSASGGAGLAVHEVSSNGWTEEAVTWNSRPPLGRRLTTVEPVGSGIVFVDLPTLAVRRPGTYSFALTATSGTVTVSSKETFSPYAWRKPRLMVSDETGEIAAGEPVIRVDATSAVGTVSEGLFSNNHRYVNGGFGVLDPSTNTVKPELVEAGRELGVTGLRFPGGLVAEGYDWRRGIGPVELRPQGYEYGVMEHMAYVEALGPEAVAWTPMTLARDRSVLSVNEAAGFVEFMNSPDDGSNPGGGTEWARVRSDLGHPAPYGIRYWVLGNELHEDLDAWLDGGDPSGWVGLLALQDAMKAVDSTIEVGIGWELGFDKVFQALAERGAAFDFVDAHGNEASHEGGGLTAPEEHYRGIDAATHVADYYVQAKAEIARYPSLAGRMDVYSLENDAGSHPLRTALHHTLANAVNLAQLIRTGVAFQSHSPYTSGPVNPFAAPIRTEHIQFDADFQRWFFTAPSFAYRLYANRLSERVVPTTIRKNPVAEAPGWGGLPIRKLYAVAALNGSADVLDLVVTNADHAKEWTTLIRINGFVPQSAAEVYEVNGPDVTAGNSLDDPSVVDMRPRPSPRVAGRFRYTFPAHSITAIRLVRSGTTPSG
jgi:hypothetical protein